MINYFVMRRANGDLYATWIDGHLCIPVWSNWEETERYRVHNPELMLFIQTPLTRRLIEKARLENEKIRLFLLSEGLPDAPLDEGKEVTLEELFPRSQAAA